MTDRRMAKAGPQQAPRQFLERRWAEGWVRLERGLRPRRLLASLGRQLLMLVMSVLVLFPLWFMTVTAFKSQTDYLHNRFGLPARIAFDSFAEILRDNPFVIWFLNSLLLTIMSIVLSIGIASLAAYAITVMDFRGKRPAFSLLVTLMAVPPIVIAIPLFVLMTRVHLVNTYYSALAIYIGLLLPHSVYLISSFFRTLPPDTLDAAVIDGCSPFGVFMRIVMPLSKPAIVTLALANGVFAWNELLIALTFLQKDSMRTLMAGLSTFKGQYDTNVPLTMAGLLLATVPMVLLYAVGQRYFVRGLVAGSIK